MVIFSPVFNCSHNLLSSAVERLTTGTNNFVSFTLNVALFRAFITGLARIFSCAGTATCELYQSKHNFQTMSKSDLFHN